MSVKPEDILSDEQNHTEIGGVAVRKGSIAAFMANIKIIEASSSTTEHQQDAWQMLKELAPALKALGVPEFVVFKNSKVQALFEN